MGSGFYTEKFSYNLPSVINPSARYVFFLHGKIVEKRGPNGSIVALGFMIIMVLLNPLETKASW